MRCDFCLLILWCVSETMRMKDELKRICYMAEELKNSKQIEESFYNSLVKRCGTVDDLDSLSRLINDIENGFNGVFRFDITYKHESQNKQLVAFRGHDIDVSNILDKYKDSSKKIFISEKGKISTRDVYRITGLSRIATDARNQLVNLFE